MYLRKRGAIPDGSAQLKFTPQADREQTVFVLSGDQSVIQNIVGAQPCFGGTNFLPGFDPAKAAASAAARKPLDVYESAVPGEEDMLYSDAHLDRNDGRGMSLWPTSSYFREQRCVHCGETVGDGAPHDRPRLRWAALGRVANI